MSVMGIQIEHHIVCNNSKDYTKLEDRLGALGSKSETVVEGYNPSSLHRYRKISRNE